MSSGAWTRVDVTRTHLELRSLAALRPAAELVADPEAPVRLTRRRPVPAAEYRALYTVVGQRWFWRDRLVWTDDELDAYLASRNVHIWVLSAGGATAGFFELQQRPTAAVELMYFGLVPAFIGRRLGGWLLTRAAEEAFALGGERMILNTCTLDAPQALPNYLARGFTIVREERYLLELPERLVAADALRAPRRG